MMRHSRSQFTLLWLGLGAWLSAAPLPTHGAQPPADPVVPKWQRWELQLRSSVTYTNPAAQVQLRIRLTSPLGETHHLAGFWDGGLVWRARFKPGFPGRWQYRTICSDTANDGLHGRTGAFLCSAPADTTVFARHGPIQVARDGQHLEHADHTPFFWLGDAAWAAAERAGFAEWSAYLNARRRQKFNVTLWRLPATHGPEQTPLFDTTAGFLPNPAAFRELERKVVAANQANLLNAVVPLWEIGPRPGPELPEAHAVSLLRYVLARWGADDVVWLVAFDCDSSGRAARRWQNICRQVFNSIDHAPVILLPGESFWVYDGFRSEPWVAGFGFQISSVTDANSLPWLLGGPPAQERSKLPAHPLLSIIPPMADPAPAAGQTVSFEFARRLLWWNALLITPAGVTYATRAVSEWNTNPARGSTWQQALAGPEIQAFAALSDVMAGTDFWELQPSPTPLLAAVTPAALPIYPLIATNRTTALVYLPEGQAIHLAARIWSGGAATVWRDLRTNQTHPAQAAPVPGSNRLALQPPAPGDWLLEIPASPTAGKTTPQQIAN